MARFADLIGSIDSTGSGRNSGASAPDLHETQAEVTAALAALSTPEVPEVPDERAAPDPTEALAAAFGTGPTEHVGTDNTASLGESPSLDATLGEINDDLLPTYPVRKGRR